MSIQVDDAKLSAQLAELPVEIATGLRRVYELMEAANPLDRSSLGQALYMQQLDEARTIMVRVLEQAGVLGRFNTWSMKLGLQAIESLLAKAQAQRGRPS